MTDRRRTRPFCHFLLLFMLAAAASAVPLARAQNPATQPDDVQQRIDARLRLLQEDENRRTLGLIEQFAERVHEVTVTLGELAKKTEALDVRMKALLTSDDGKRLGCDKLAFHGFMQYLDQPVVTLEQISVRKKPIDAILSGLQDELKHHTPGYLPGEAPRREVEDAGAWARSLLATVSEHQSWFDTAIAKSPKDVDLTKRTTLDEAIKRIHADEQEAYLRAVMESRDEARREMDKLIRDTAKHVEEERLRAENERKLREAAAEIERMKTEYETKLKAQDAEQKRQAAAAETRYKDLMAELERTRQLAEARRKAEDVKTDIEKKKIEDAAEKQKRIQQCKAPEVQQLLAPFLAKGYWQPGDKSGSNIDSKPISYSKLTAFGALQPTSDGIQKLLRVATKDVHYGGLDKVRPRWSYSPLLNRLSASELEEVKKAQAYLIELGPVMVEQGLLSE